ncbi:nucleotidyltransferase [Clostridium sp. SM-530-WT-3G]|uniref:nucleotidyltransferase n=1 Tax=Clostridium sp. SM-530-WT-3G TaxID=2725303 RepID=UPI00145F315D|nr:nucleotidyltransferase [Clostridium sp. SM-530-WT-3G]NME81742.1 nucleotidyltransferase [Clostridium sp. SM-530-WT-3G]
MITGIITEYNPFHKGHAYHLLHCKKDTKSSGVVCVMSGNFMQRGIPAIVDKWKRAEMAVKNGVDLVIELPLVYSISSAEYFAFGGISLLNNLGIIDTVYFGSEHGNIDVLDSIADVLSNEPLEYKKLLKKHLDNGFPFHSSRSIALDQYLKNENVKEVLSNSNNILGIEYIKAIKSLNSKIIPKTLKREGSSYNEETLSKSFASATSIRKHLKENSIDLLGDVLTEESFAILNNLHQNNYKFTFEEDMFKYIKYKLLTNENALASLPDVSEGLDNKIYKEILSSNSLDQLILSVKSKRYTYTRINRILAQCFLNLENYDLLKLAKSPAPYARVLAFNNTGREILKKMKKTSTIDIITKIPKNNLCDHLKLDILGTKAYSVLNNHINPMADYFNGPIII